MAFIAPAQQLTLPDGRILSYAVYGSPDSNAVVFYHHGFPANRDEALCYHESAQRHNIRLVSTDRPGMGGSTYQPNRRFLDWPSDLLNLADHLQVGKFAVVGISGGAPYALASWHQLPRSRCIGAGIVSGMYPLSFGVGGMLVANRVLLWVGPWSPWLAGKALDMAMGAAGQDKAHPEKLEKLLDQSFQSRPGPDRDVWAADTSHARLALVTSIREAFRNGGQGAGWEANLLGSDWGFSLEQTVQPGTVVLWHGSADVNCPVKMAERASEVISGAELRAADGEAHFSMVLNKRDEVMETLAKMFSSA